MRKVTTMFPSNEHLANNLNHLHTEHVRQAMQRRQLSISVEVINSSPPRWKRTIQAGARAIAHGARGMSFGLRAAFQVAAKPTGSPPGQAPRIRGV